MAEETERPTRTFPRALFVGLAVTGTIYILVAIVSAMVVPAADLAASSGPLLEVVERAGVNFPPRLFAAIALVAVLNTALLNMLMASRLIYGMANQRVVPRVLGMVHPTRRTPWIAIIFTTLLAVVLIASTSDFGQLGQTTVLLLLVVFAIVNIAVLVLRRESVGHEHFRTPTWAPILGAIACLILATPITGRTGRVYLIALILLAIGVVFWFISYGAKRATGERDFRPEEISG